MAKVPGFIFYPGDYLQDTQNLSGDAQAAYDRIMCLHMKNTSISKQQLDFFTKRLNPDQKNELMAVLHQSEEGYFIQWVVDSIMKYRKFCDSRSKNRQGKTKKQVNNTSNSLEKLVENEIVNEDEDINNRDRGVGKEGKNLPITHRMLNVFRQYFPKYPFDQDVDLRACAAIAIKIAKANGWPQESITNGKLDAVLQVWEPIAQWAADDSWYSSRSLTDFNTEFQRLMQSYNGKRTKKTQRPAGGLPNGLSPSEIRDTGAGRL